MRKSSLINKSIAASLMIGIGDFILLKMGNPLGPFLFALGLLAVCYMGLNLFTGKYLQHFGECLVSDFCHCFRSACPQCYFAAFCSKKC